MTKEQYDEARELEKKIKSLGQQLRAVRNQQIVFTSSHVLPIPMKAELKAVCDNYLIDVQDEIDDTQDQFDALMEEAE